MFQYGIILSMDTCFCGILLSLKEFLHRDLGVRNLLHHDIYDVEHRYIVRCCCFMSYCLFLFIYVNVCCVF